MGEIFKIRTAKIIAYIGVTLIVIGLILQISNLIKENKKQQEIIKAKETEIAECREELKETYIKYLYLEEENMVLWNMYYSAVSEYNGEYQYYE